MVNNKLKSKALKNPPTMKPFTILEVNRTIRALITKVNSPRLKRFTGKVRIRRTGLMIKFKRPSTSETINAVHNPATTTPGSK